MIAIAVSSNLQGTATLIGDPPSMLLGGFAKMNFMDFFFYKGRPSIFFAVQAGAFASFLVLYFIFRNFRQKIKLELTEKVETWAPTLILVLLIVCLALERHSLTRDSLTWPDSLAWSSGVASLIMEKNSLVKARYLTVSARWTGTRHSF
jgi:Na+/H+ antiporter NhaD/arsenite permease-like protein